MEQQYKKSRIKSRISWAIAIILALFAVVVSITPFIFMVLNSFKDKFEMLTKGVFALQQCRCLSGFACVAADDFGICVLSIVTV